jgi:hypothetical protein
MTRRVRELGRPVSRLAVPVWCCLLTVVVLGPALAPGFVLTYDMVFTPRQYLLPDSLGVGTAAPRAVPVDAVMALLTAVIPGQLVQKVVLIAILFCGGLGASRLVAGAPLGVRLVAATAYVWNPYVAERLVIGHWTLLVAYAALPWLVRGALAARFGGAGPLACLVVLAALCSLTPTGGLLAAGVVVAAMCLPDATWRARALSAVTVVVVNAPWWLPGVLQDAAARGDPTGVAVFAARSDTLWGDIGSLLGLGGIWNAQVVPDSRGSVFAAVALVLVLCIGGVGLLSLVRTAPRLAAVLGAMGVVGLGLAALGTVPVGRSLLEAIMRTVPGGGLLRDGQKFIALLAPLEAVCFATGVGVLAGLLARRTGSVLGSRALLAGALLLPLVALPDLAWGVNRHLDPVSYPSDWAQVRSVLADRPDHGDVLVLPWSAFRQFEWNDRRTSLDPAARFFPVTAVGSTELVVGNETVHDDDPRVARVEQLLHSGEPLRTTMGTQGIGWVLVERKTPGPAVPDGLLSGARPVVSGDSVQLFQLPGAVSPTPKPHLRLVATVDLLVLLLVCGCAALAFRRRGRRPLLS